MTKQTPRTFVECLQHFRDSLPNPRTAVMEYRTAFPRTPISTIEHWFYHRRSKTSPQGYRRIEAETFLMRRGYQIIGLGGLHPLVCEIREAIADRVISSREFVKAAGYTSTSHAYIVLYGKSNPPKDRLDRFEAVCREIRAKRKRLEEKPEVSVVEPTLGSELTASGKRRILAHTLGSLRSLAAVVAENIPVQEISGSDRSEARKSVQRICTALGITASFPLEGQVAEPVTSEDLKSLGVNLPRKGRTNE